MVTPAEKGVGVKADDPGGITDGNFGGGRGNYVGGSSEDEP